MTLVAVVSGGAAPGVTTSTVLLAATWPGPIVVADCDPAGGQVASGWLGEWLLAGALRPQIGLVSFVAATRHAPAGTAAALEQHLQSVPAASGVRLLSGLQHAGQSGSLDAAGWQRVADALAGVSASGGDVVVDCGRVAAASPWPVLRRADVVLVAARHTVRSVLAARAAVAQLREQVDPDRLGLLVCAASGAAAKDLERALAMRVRVELPFDARTAAVYSDGAAPPRGLERAPLVRAAHSAARSLAATTPLSVPGQRAPARAGLSR